MLNLEFHDRLRELNITIEGVQNALSIVVLFLWCTAFIFPSKIRLENNVEEYVTPINFKLFLFHRESVTVLVFLSWLPCCAVALSYYTSYIPSNDLIENKLREITPILYLGVCCMGFFRAKNYTAGFLIAVCGIFISATIIATSTIDLLKPDIDQVNHTRALALLTGSVATLCSFAGLRRYPDVSFDGENLDRQAFASIFEFLSFSWGADSYSDHANPIAKIRELPGPRVRYRTSEVVERTSPYDPKTGLWSWLFKVYRGPFILQWVVIIVKSAFAVVPPYFVLQFLQALEAREPGSPTTPALLLLVVGIAVSAFADKFVNILEQTITYRWLRQPMAALLQSMIYRKALRLENVNDPDPTSESKGTKKSTRAIMAHMRNDVSKVAGATQDLTKMPVAFFELAFASYFLVQLLSYRAVMFGIAIAVLSLPTGALFSNHYRILQNNLTIHREGRMSLLTQVLRNIRQIRFSGSEDFWIKKIFDVRRREQADDWSAGLAMCTYVFLSNLSLVCLGAVPLIMHALEHDGITASVAFTCMNLFSTVNGSISMVPLAWSFGMEARAAADRLQAFFRRPERSDVVVPYEKIIFDHASITWPTSVSETDREVFQLSDLDFGFPPKRFSLISGPTASGKTLLLNAIIGEVKLLSGQIKSPAGLPSNSNGSPRVAFVSPNPWMEDTTIQENILFGAEPDNLRYRKVLEACGLRPDLRLLKDGDQTELGPKAATLSGGQRWRLSLARALYSQAKTIVLGDIMSAVDVQMREWLLKHALTGELARGRTIILATHHVDLCRPRASFQVHLADGKVARTERLTPVEYRIPRYEDYSERFGSDDTEKSTKKPTTKKPSKFNGWESLGIWMERSGPSIVWPLMLTSIVLHRLFVNITQWLMKEVTNLLHGDEIESSWLKVDQIPGDPPTYNEILVSLLQLYLIANVLSCIFVAAYNLFSYIIAQRTSKLLFEDMVQGVFRGTLDWVDNVPRGEVNSRYMGDMKAVDSYLQPSMAHLISSVVNVVAIIIACAKVSEAVCLCACVLLVGVWYNSSSTLAISEELQKTESASHAPIFDRMSSLLAPGGLTTVRAYRREDDFIDMMHERIDNQSTAGWAQLLCTESSAMNTRVIGLVLRATIAIAAVQFHTPASTVGFVLTVEGNFTRAASDVLSRVISLQGLLQSAGRVHEYGIMPRERLSGFDAPKAWPSRGEVVIDNFSAGYDDKTSVLKRLNLTFAAGSRVGIVGRTGAGKSSFTLALFRLIGALRGSIKIDGVELSTLKLQVLRSKLFIIPQDPFLYGGTLRANIDSEGKYTDAQINKALVKVQIGLPLDFDVADGGGNLSQGQRQLICLSRALLARPKVLVLDEPTSSVDMETDGIVQRVLREDFKDSTMIVIAHRLSSVADFDKIVVLNEGVVAEEGTPADLVAKKGAFWDMVKKSTDKTALLAAIQQSAGSSAAAS